jgi:hypothetical protein
MADLTDERIAALRRSLKESDSPVPWYVATDRKIYDRDGLAATTHDNHPEVQS